MHKKINYLPLLITNLTIARQNVLIQFTQLGIVVEGSATLPAIITCREKIELPVLIISTKNSFFSI